MIFLVLRNVCLCLLEDCASGSFLCDRFSSMNRFVRRFVLQVLHASPNECTCERAGVADQTLYKYNILSHQSRLTRSPPALIVIFAVAAQMDFAPVKRRGPFSGPADGACAICLGTLAIGDDAATLGCAAAHCFHWDCAKDWHARWVLCPLCWGRRRDSVVLWSDQFWVELQCRSFWTDQSNYSICVRAAPASRPSSSTRRSCMPPLLTNKVTRESRLCRDVPGISAALENAELSSTRYTCPLCRQDFGPLEALTHRCGDIDGRPNQFPRDVSAEASHGGRAPGGGESLIVNTGGTRGSFAIWCNQCSVGLRDPEDYMAHMRLAHGCEDISGRHNYASSSKAVNLEPTVVKRAPPRTTGPVLRADGTAAADDTEALTLALQAPLPELGSI